MKWKTNKPKKDKSKWHKHFLLKPTCIGKFKDGSKNIAWLETVWRKGRWVTEWSPNVKPYWEWEYKSYNPLFPNICRQCGEFVMKDQSICLLCEENFKFGDTETMVISGKVECDPETFFSSQLPLPLNMTGEGLDHQTRLYNPPPPDKRGRGRGRGRR